MTTTNVLTTQSIGTSTNKGDAVLPQKVTLTSGTTAIRVEAKITNGAASYPNTYLRFAYVVSSFDLTAAAAALALKGNATLVDIPLRPAGGDITIKSSLLDPAAGAYLYIWFYIPATTVACTLALNTVELP